MGDSQKSQSKVPIIDSEEKGFALDISGYFPTMQGSMPIPSISSGSGYYDEPRIGNGSYFLLIARNSRVN